MMTYEEMTAEVRRVLSDADNELVAEVARAEAADAKSHNEAKYSAQALADFANEARQIRRGVADARGRLGDEVERLVRDWQEGTRDLDAIDPEGIDGGVLVYLKDVPLTERDVAVLGRRYATNATMLRAVHAAAERNGVKVGPLPSMGAQAAQLGEGVIAAARIAARRLGEGGKVVAELISCVR